MSKRPITRPSRRRQDVLQDSIVREFNGGWNVIDSDLNLNSSYARVLDNMSRLPDGSIGTRWGTRLFTELSGVNVPQESLILVSLIFNTHAGWPRNRIVIDLRRDNPSFIDGLGPHELYDGYIITIAGVMANSGESGTLNNIPLSEINKTHVVRRISASRITIDVETEYDPESPSFDDEIHTRFSTQTIKTDEQLQAATITHLHDQVVTDNEVIVNMTYYAEHTIVVTRSGHVYSIDNNGTVYLIWSNGIASLSAIGDTDGWNETAFVSFAAFNGELIICNGRDKPIIINFDREAGWGTVTYLHDVATGSNLHVPVCRYVLTMDNYLIMAGDLLNPDRVHISNRSTSGTWYGDEAPNDATYVDLGKVVPVNEQTIRGISRFRGKLVVGFDDVVALGTLGNYVDGEHMPRFDDTIEGHGCIAHRSLISLGNDLLMCDNIGVPSISTALFTDAERPDRTSQLIDPEIQRMLHQLSVATAEDHVFSVYNIREGQYMLFVPNDNLNPTETTCFVYTTIPAMKIKAWARYAGWNFNCACRTALGRVLFAKGNKIYAYGAEEDKIHADYIGDAGINNGEGVPINFVWELPWTDFNRRMKLKASRFLSFDTRGEARFTCKMFVDNFNVPTLSAEFVAGDAPGYGVNDVTYGSGRRTSDERLEAWPVSFKIAKIRIEGSSTKPLRIVSIGLMYHYGSIRR